MIRTWLGMGVGADAIELKKRRAKAPAHTNSKSLDPHGLSSRQGGLQFARLERLVAMVNFFPVDHVPPRRQIFRPSIVVLQVIGVLPNVVAENREQTL